MAIALEESQISDCRLPCTKPPEKSSKFMIMKTLKWMECPPKPIKHRLFVLQVVHKYLSHRYLSKSLTKSKNESLVCGEVLCKNELLQCLALRTS